MNVFSNLRVFGGNWNVSSRRKFNDAEKSIIREANVVDSHYGYSVCFLLKDNTMRYIPLTSDSTLTSGELNIDSLEVLVLSKPGESDIMRIDGELKGGSQPSQESMQAYTASLPDNDAPF